MKTFVSSLLAIFLILGFSTSAFAQNDFDKRDGDVGGVLTADLEVTGMLKDDVYARIDKGGGIPDGVDGTLSRYIADGDPDGNPIGWVDIAKARVKDANGFEVTFDLTEPLNMEYMDASPNKDEPFSNTYRFTWMSENEMR